MTALCLACGLCCNGALHTYTRLRPREAAALRRLGAPLYPLSAGCGEKKRTAYALHQPCPYWQDQRCAIYAQRPKSCRTYECLLYKRLAAALISAEESLARLHKALALIEQRDDPALASQRERHAAMLHFYLLRHFEPDSLTLPTPGIEPGAPPIS